MREARTWDAPIKGPSYGGHMACIRPSLDGLIWGVTVPSTAPSNCSFKARWDRYRARITVAHMVLSPNRQMTTMCCVSKLEVHTMTVTVPHWHILNTISYADTFLVVISPAAWTDMFMCGSQYSDRQTKALT